MTDTGAPSAAARAEQLLQELIPLIDQLRRSDDEDDRDTAWGLTRDMLNLVLEAEQVVPGGYGGYLVVLDRKLRDQEATDILRLLTLPKGVVAVVPVREGDDRRASQYFATVRLQDRLRDALAEALDHFDWAPDD